MALTPLTPLETTKLLLVACDQAYFVYRTLPAGRDLEALEDRARVGPNSEYLNTNLYKQRPDYGTVGNGYKVLKTIERESIGAKAIIYQHTVTKEVIVAMGGTDGIDSRIGSRTRRTLAGISGRS